jgi:MFS family permease
MALFFFQNILVSQFSHSNKLVMIGIGSCLIGTGMFMLNYPYSVMFIVLSCIVYSTGEMIFFSMAQLFCYQASTHKKKGRGLGAYRMVYASSRFVGPAVGGAIYHHLGSSVLWSASGIIGITFLLLCSHFRDFA